MKKKIVLLIKKYLPYILSMLFLVSVLLFFAFSMNSVEKELVTYKTEKGQEIYFYIEAVKYEYNSKITLGSDNEVIKLTTEDYTHDYDSEPIYFKNKRKALLPNDMSVVFTKSNYIQNRIDKFSILESDNGFYIKNKGLNYYIENAFLYDGKDTYVFLNETEIKAGDKTFVLSPLSYVIFNYNKELFAYDYESDKMNYLYNVTDNVYAVNKDYKIDLNIDSIINKDSQKLLMKNLTFLNKLK